MNKRKAKSLVRDKYPKKFLVKVAHQGSHIALKNLTPEQLDKIAGNMDNIVFVTFGNDSSRRVK